jgi:purine-binding chemotaxis protein CheW
MHQYLTFSLDREEYGIDILRVQEIRSTGAITPIPNTPSHLRGVMNLRGTIIPVVDLRAKLGIATAEATDFTAIVVVTVGSKIVGLIVDAVSDVLNIPASDIQAAPDFGGSFDIRFVGGIARANERLVVLLDIERVLGAEDLAAVGTA